MKYFLVICLLLAGCSSGKVETDGLPDGWQAFSTYGNITVIVPVTMSDGTRCVVATGIATGKSISCDWSKTK